MGSLDAIIQKLWEDAPLVGLLGFIIFAGYKRWWVWGYQLHEKDTQLIAMKAERDEWKDVAFRGVHSTAVAVKTTERAVEAMKGSS